MKINNWFFLKERKGKERSYPLLCLAYKSYWVSCFPQILITKCLRNRAEYWQVGVSSVFISENIKTAKDFNLKMRYVQRKDLSLLLKNSLQEKEKSNQRWMLLFEKIHPNHLTWAGENRTLFQWWGIKKRGAFSGKFKWERNQELDWVKSSELRDSGSW